MAKIVEVAVVEQWSFVTPHRAPPAGYRPIPDQGFRVGEEFRSGQWHTRTLTKMTLQPC